jgi:hypothetical protein
MLDIEYKQRISQMEAELAQLLSAEFVPFGGDNVDAIPEAPGVYLIKEKDGGRLAAETSSPIASNCDRELTSGDKYHGYCSTGE